MEPQILVAYATKHGSTREVAEAIAGELRELGLEADAAVAAVVDDLSPYDGVVVGGSLYMGRWHPDALRFLQRHRRALAIRPVAVFGMGPRTTEAGEVADSRAQLGRSLAKVRGIDPFAVAIFGGVVDPAQLRFPLNRLPATDARDWTAIRAWAGDVAAAFDYGKAAAGARDLRTELPQTPR
jgi:menaquinone-dependent protoporphyrinogen oxidase